jgi:LysM repeat protein
MLDPYQKEMSNNENDLLPDSQAPMSRRKLIFVLSGASFALLFFLFLMGAFRGSDDEGALQQSSTLSFEEKVQGLSQRVEKLEQQLAMIQKSCPGQQAQPTSTAKTTIEPALTSIEEAVAMTGHSLKQFISNEALAVSGSIATAKSEPKSSKSKSSSKEVLVKALDGAQTYVVQKGDTLSKISVRFFGTPNRWKAIFEANKDRINNVNNLKVGTTIVIPQK